MRNLRLFFSKTDRAKYVSHLDLNRTMLRAIRRSGIPIWYTEGFNPHPYISFPLPLPLGVESLRDVMDIRIDGEMKDTEIIEKLNAVMPSGLKILSAIEPWCKANEITAADYEFLFQKEGFQKEALIKILESKEIIVQKMGKQKGRKVMKDVNLAEYIFEYSINEADNYYTLQIKLSAGSTKNANPVLLAEALTEGSNNKLNILNIRRTALLTADGKEFN